jgi:hypothetical protein
MVVKMRPNDCRLLGAKMRVHEKGLAPYLFSCDLPRPWPKRRQRPHQGKAANPSPKVYYYTPTRRPVLLEETQQEIVSCVVIALFFVSE